MVECPKCGTAFDEEGSKIARCPDCRQTFKSEAHTPKKPKPSAKSKAKEPPKPAAPPPPPAEDMYGFQEDVDLGKLRAEREAAEEKRRQEKKKDAKPIIQIKRKNIGDLSIWAYIDKSMIWYLIGVISWGTAHLLFGLILFLGMVQGPEYARPVVEFLIRRDQPPLELGQGDSLDRVSFVLAMLGGSNLVSISFALLLIIQILGWVRIGMWLTGYSISLQGVEHVEPVGGRGQLIALYSLSGFNFFMNLILVLLPLVGAFSYLLMPLWGVEMVMAKFNMERSVPLHIFWSYAPFWETLLTLIILVAFHMEPLMIVYFIWTCASAMKDDALEQSAVGTLRMGFAILFLLVAFNLFALTGTSPVLVQVLRILYLMWFSFIIAWIVRVAQLITKTRETFKFYFFPDAD